MRMRLYLHLPKRSCDVPVTLPYRSHETGKVIRREKLPVFGNLRCTSAASDGAEGGCHIPPTAATATGRIGQVGESLWSSSMEPHNCKTPRLAAQRRIVCREFNV